MFGKQFLLLQKIFLIVLISGDSLMNAQVNIFQFSPDQPHCLGEEVTLTCYLFPTGPAYRDFALLSFNGSSTETLNNVNTNRASIGYSATVAIPLMGSSARIQLTIASFQVSDNNTLFGCHAEFSSNGSVTGVLESGYPPIATPPLPPALAVSLTSLDPASCSGSVSIAWTPGDSDRSVDTYFLFLNGDLINTLSSSINTYSHSISIILDTNYTYSITANSCAGNSTQPNQDTIYIESTSLINSGPSSVFLSYAVSGMLSVDWGLTPISRNLNISYSLQINYNHSQYGNISNFYLPNSFSLLSNTSISTVTLIPNEFNTQDGVVTNITACISITSQCGITFSGETVCGFYNSDATTSTLPTNAPFPIGIVAGAVGGGAAVLLILLSILFLILICICCGKKSGDKFSQKQSEDHMELSAPSYSTENVPSEAMYSQISKTPKTQELYSSIHKQAPPQKELLYADLDHVIGQTERVHPPVAPQTQYTDLAQFPRADQTLYASVHTDGPN